MIIWKFEGCLWMCSLDIFGGPARGSSGFIVTKRAGTSQFEALANADRHAWTRERIAVVITGCGKIQEVSFRGRGLSEESAFFLALAEKADPSLRSGWH
jgi:hypothetical protein